MTAPARSAATHRAIEAVWRIEAASVIAGVARLVRDVGLAEELAQDALVAALERWPATGVPDNPGAWLMTTAKNRARDRLRLDAIHRRKHEQIGHELEALQADVEPDFVEALDAARQDDIGDDLLRLVFTACHPLLSTEARVALTLRLLGGLSTAEIARAFLASESTIAQRIVRAKRSLSAARVPFEVPGPRERTQRLASVLEVIYLIFNEGYAATSGEDWMRPALCDEALRLGRILAELTPGDSEVHGLVALMELQASRLHARSDAQGRPVLLLEQDRGRWDTLLIRRGLAALERAESLGGASVLGPGIVRELCFRVLVGEQGGAIRAALASQGNFGRISRVLRRIHDDYAQPMEVATLAREAGLSAPAFHAHFKTIAGTSPIQYIKSIRLHQARLMMIRDNLTAAAASARVGYESASQFNREFKRLFGRSPGEEAREMRAIFALLPAAQLEGVAATH